MAISVHKCLKFHWYNGITYFFIKDEVWRASTFFKKRYNIDSNLYESESIALQTFESLFSKIGWIKDGKIAENCHRRRKNTGGVIKYPKASFCLFHISIKWTLIKTTLPKITKYISTLLGPSEVIPGITGHLL